MEKLVGSLSQFQAKILTEKSIQFICLIDSSWGSQTDLNKSQINSALESQKISNPHFQFHSKSHCPNAGSILLSSHPCGVDIELEPRLEEHIIQRVSNQTEIKESPDLKRLWSAKEAAFKSLKNIQQPKVISAIDCHSWKKLLDFPFYEFQASVNQQVVGFGYSYLSAEFSLSIFFANTQNS